MLRNGLRPAANNYAWRPNGEAPSVGQGRPAGGLRSTAPSVAQEYPGRWPQANPHDGQRAENRVKQRNVRQHVRISEFANYEERQG